MCGFRCAFGCAALARPAITATANRHRRASWEETAPIAPALRAFFDDVLEASVAELNFKAIVDGLGAVLFEYPFRCVCVWWWLVCARFAAHGNLNENDLFPPSTQQTPNKQNLGAKK